MLRLHKGAAWVEFQGGHGTVFWHTWRDTWRGLTREQEARAKRLLGRWGWG